MKERASGPAVVIAVLITVLAALLGPVQGSGDLSGRTAPASVSAGGTPYADDGHSAVGTVLLRSPRDVPGERPAHAAALDAPCGPSGPDPSARTPRQAVSPPAPSHPADRPPGRAPPSPPGT
ncbi:hypothetical protein ABZ016_23045 [Streptomyces sp. NPDC006372]|uniref:hypothetical protein n=1 Tax=Streptomyces sp. NPDC006372 TaxID=3155599 RepID=UPI0033A0455D